MDKLNVDSIYEFIKKTKARPIGIGTTSICFLLNNGKTLKLYLNTYNKRFVFTQHNDIIDYFDKLSRINNDSYVTLDTVLIQNGVCIGYIYDYVKGKTLHNIDKNLDLNYFLDNYKKLEEDTYHISDDGLYLHDVNENNIIISDSIKIIDLDLCDFEEHDNNFKHNMMKINETILYSLLNESKIMIINYVDDDLDKLFNLALCGNYNDIKNFIMELKQHDINNKRDMVKRKRMINVRVNDYKIRF